MLLSDWCSYDYYFGTVENCECCKMRDACKCPLHCNYQVFSDLTKLQTQEEVNAEMARMLSYYNNPKCKQRGKYFWELACDGRGTWSRDLLRENLNLEDNDDGRQTLSTEYRED